MQNDVDAYPKESDLVGAEIFKDPGEFVKEYSRIWTEVLVEE